MKTGKIYKFTNQFNNKVYIGQTTLKIEERLKKHLTQLDDDTYFHRAIKKYGINNFSLEVVEDNIPLQELDDREIYWIKITDAYYKSGKGYNLTKGGKWSNSSQLLCGSAEDEIKDLIKNSDYTFKQIGDLYGVSLSCISDINREKTFFESDRDYSIRKTPTRSILNAEIVNEIISMLQETNNSIENIALSIGVKAYTVGEINRGKNSWCPKHLAYPIRKGIKQNTYQNKIDQEQVKEICYQLIFTNNTLDNIAKQYNLGKNTVGDISRGITWKEITNQFILPIRKNKLENKTIYNSIYSIV